MGWIGGFVVRMLVSERRQFININWDKDGGEGKGSRTEKSRKQAKDHRYQLTCTRRPSSSHHDHHHRRRRRRHLHRYQSSNVFHM